MKNIIIISLPLKERHVERIRGEFPDATVYQLSGRESVTDAHKDCTIYLGSITKEELSAAPNLRFLQAAYAGVDALLFPELSRSNVRIASAKGIHNTQMSELFFAMLLYCGRSMQLWAQQKREREWNKDPVKEGFFLAGSQLIIVGYGTIGKKIAMIARTFDMRVIGCRSTVTDEDRNSDPFTDELIPVSELNSLLPDSDIILNLLPHTPDTESFFDRNMFSGMKQGSVFVNLGRGKTVDDGALLDALESGTVRWAALDVFRDEPLPNEHPFWTHPKVVMTPHIGGLMPDYWDAVVSIFIENVRRLSEGDELMNLVDTSKGY
jgi:D-2-hydroxyacid dehydrogenase (NADP+)